MHEAVAPHTRVREMVANRLGTPQITVVVPVTSEAEALTRYLPAVLAQEGVRYEVIAVMQQTDEAVRTALEGLRQQHPRLRLRAIDPTARYLSREKFAVTLGVRAARGEWVVVLAPDCEVPSPRWLAALAARTTAEVDFLLPYTVFRDDYTALYRRAAYRRLRRYVRYARAARWGHAVGGDAACFAFRRSAFFAVGGYGESAAVVPGCCDALVRRAAASRVLCFAAPAVLVRQDMPSREALRLAALSRREAGRGMRSPYVRLLSLRDGAASLALWAFIPLIALYVGAGAWLGVSAHCAPALAALDGFTLVALCLLLWLPYHLLRRATRPLGEPCPQALALLIDDLGAPLRHRRQHWAHRRARHRFARN